MCYDAPDTTKQQEAALLTAELSKEQLEWAKQIYAETAPDRAEAKARANRLSDLQMGMMQRSMDVADEERDRYNATFRPVEQRIVSDAMSFDTQDRRNAAAGEAVADVSQAFNAARDQGTRAMTRMGVNPNDGRMAAMQSQTDAQQALAQATAANQARKQIETQGWARRMDAAGLGKGVVSNQATQAGLAGQLGSGALNASNAALGAGLSGAGVMQQGYQGAIGGMGTAANIWGNIAQQEAGGNNAGLWGALGNVAGAAINKW